jgi:molybdenum cofactor cytidylyltransferase
LSEHSDAALILAAGASRRLGGTPKSSLRVGPESSIQRVVRLSAEEGFDPIIVVVGPHRDLIHQELVGSSARMVPNEEWERGRTGSVQVGLASLPPEAKVLLWPVDHPFVEAKTLRALRTTGVTDQMASWIIPTFEGRGGHPVLLRPSAAKLVATLAPELPLRTVLPRLGPQVRRLPVDDPFVLANVDSWDSYGRTAEEWERRKEDSWTVD